MTSRTMTNQDIARIFYDIAAILELQDADPFRVRAYNQAATVIEGLIEEIPAIYHEDGLRGLEKIPGVGKELALKIEELVKTNDLKFYRTLKKEVPQGLLAVLEVEGIGPQKTKFVWKKFGVTTLKQLEHLCRGQKLQQQKGWGQKTVDNILRAIKLKQAFGARKPLGLIYPIAFGIKTALQKSGLINQIEIAGSLRRMKEDVGDIDILATSKHPQKIIKLFAALPEIKEIKAKGETKCTVFLKSGIDADLRVVSPDEFGAGLYYFTGSQQHNVRARELAITKGLTINEYGIFRGTAERHGKRVAARTEAAVFRALGLLYIPPELREDRGEFDAAKIRTLPHLIEDNDLQGDLHTHTSWSGDGHNTPLEMIRAAKAKGLHYIAVTDHSSPLGMLKGIKTHNIKKYINEIRSAAAKVKGIRVLVGAEVDILPDGRPYLPDGALKQLDFVVASVHTAFRQSREVMTKRVIRAIQNPYISAIGHLTARILGRREPTEVDVHEVFAAAKKYGVAMEINASWYRLDLNDVHCRAAKEVGVKLVMSTDSHDVDNFDFTFGIGTARRGWIEKKNVLNTLPYAQFVKAVRKSS
ncbi:MAG: DNA polymerase/3'-5' exonuclease PolX [Candidatus Magasanikbacteria bacterium]|nr:DNA polymerase/3'-5' exonuclease PolX [Candidatus Magasanikbacteria bacterium]